MEKVEEYIKKTTKTCNNKSIVNGRYYNWLTPDNARVAAEIAKEEIIKEVCEWMRKRVKNFIITDMDIEYLKKHLEKKQ